MTDRSKKLLDAIVADIYSHSGCTEEEKILKLKDRHTIIFNLLTTGKYSYSYNMYKEIQQFLDMLDKILNAVDNYLGDHNGYDQVTLYDVPASEIEKIKNKLNRVSKKLNIVILSPKDKTTNIKIFINE